MGDYVVPGDHVIVANHVLRQGYAGSVGAEGLAEDVDRLLDRRNKVRTAAGLVTRGRQRKEWTSAANSVWCWKRNPWAESG